MDFHQEWLYLEGLKPVPVPSQRQAPKPHPRTLTGTSFLDEVLEAIVNDPRFANRQLERLAVVVPKSWGRFSWLGSVMRFGSFTSVFVSGHVRDDPMRCIRLSWQRFVLMRSRTFCRGLNSKVCSTRRSSIWSDGVATVPGAVLGELMRLCMQGPQGLRQWWAGCF